MGLLNTLGTSFQVGALNSTQLASILGLPAGSIALFELNRSIPPFPNTRDNDLELAGHIGIYDAGTEISRLDVTVQIGLWTNRGRQAIWDAIRECMAWIDPRAGYQQWSFEEDTDKYLNLKLTSTGSTGFSLSPGLVEVSATADLQLKAADPHWYSKSQPSISQSFTGSVTVANPGTAPSPVVLTLHATSAVTASVASPIVVTIGGQQILWTQSMNSGDNLVIDTDKWTATINGVADLTHWSGQFPLLPGGSSNVTVNKTGLTATVQYSPRWVA